MGKPDQFGSAAMDEPSRYVKHGEIYEVSGYWRKSKQIQWLKANRIKHTVNAFGHPVVLRSHWESVLSDGPMRAKTAEPNWGRCRHD